MEEQESEVGEWNSISVLSLQYPQRPPSFPSVHPTPPPAMVGTLGPWCRQVRRAQMGQAGGAQAAKDNGEGFHQAPRALQKEQEL